VGNKRCRIAGLGTVLATSCWFSFFKPRSFI